MHKIRSATSEICRKSEVIVSFLCTNTRRETTAEIQLSSAHPYCCFLGDLFVPYLRAFCENAEITTKRGE